MKKVLALALALVMMFAVCVPAFAGELNKDHLTDDTAVVKTKTTKEDGTDAAEWKVEFPATTEIFWEKDVTNVDGCKVTAHLETGKTLTVTCAPNTMMTNGTDTITYTVGGQNSFAVDATQAVAGLTFVPTVNVAAEQWAQAPVAVYSGTLTFTAALA